MLRRETAVTISFLGMLLFSTACGSRPDFLKVLPAEAEGWTRGQAETFEGKGLTRYIDGGAELYFAYGFKNLLSVPYAKGEEYLQVDVFDMGSSENAFGVFSHSRSGVSKDFGQGSQYDSGLLLFWKDRYFFSLSAYPENDEKRRLIFVLAGRLAQAVGREGALPELLDSLPEEGLLPESVRYLRHYLWLESICPLPGENPLAFSDADEAAAGRYRRGESSAWLAVLRYGREAQAESAEKNFLRLCSAASSAQTGRLPQCGAVGAARRGRKLFLVLAATGESWAQELLRIAVQRGRP